MIGWTVKELLSALPEQCSSVKRFHFTTYVPSPVLANRLKKKSSNDSDVIVFVREALRHRGYAEPISEVRADNLINYLNLPPPAGKVRGFCSKVFLSNDESAQLPLLDFQCDVSEEKADAIVLAMKLVGQCHGALLTSGRSFHYYGFQPLKQKEWRHFMSRSVLLAPLVDVRYIAHCLIEELACLRIDSAPTHQVEPKVIRVIE